MAVLLRLLGEVGVEVDGRAVDLGSPRSRCVLAALAVDADRVVSVERLVERVWGAGAAPRARATLHGYISRLRRALTSAGGVAIVRRSGGYALITDTTEPAVDLHRFRHLRATGGAEDDELAARSLTVALELWRGQALTGVGGEWAEAERDRLEQERLATQHDLADARLRLGQGADLVAELAARAAAHPLDERVAGQYLRALHQAGRTADALEHYRQVRTRLVEELGTEPGAGLQDLHRRILATGPDLAGRPGSTATKPVVPRQLRAAPASFIGRHDELHRLDTALTAAGVGGTMAISAVTGMGGMGKTWLVLTWAHRHLDRFPDGQLFVDLRGFSPDSEPMAPSTALREFLTALGVEAGSIPSEVHAQSALFRSLAANKRMLVVLDNAADTDQVVPLLPGGESCTVLVTSRNQLTGLVAAYGARRLSLDVLPEEEARDLLAARIGTARIHAERTAVDELVGLCGGVPLALSVITAHAGVSLSTAVAELRESGLDSLDDDDPSASLPAVLSWSYRALTEEKASAFPLLAIAPGPDIGLPAAANLTGLSPARARTVLRGLEQASLLDRDTHGRYRMHDLVRAYATDIARQLPDEARNTALHRVVDYYTHAATNTATEIEALSTVRRQTDPTAAVLVDSRQHLNHIISEDMSTSISETSAAFNWFDIEHATLLAAQHVAAGHGWHHTVWQLACALNSFQYRRGYIQERYASWRIALESARHLPESAAVIRAHRLIARVCGDLKRHDDAISHLHQARFLAEQLGDLTQQAHTYRALALVYMQHGEQDRALEHSVHALALFCTADEPIWESHALNTVGWNAALLGDYDTAHRFCQAALDRHLRHANTAGVADTLDSLGYIAYHTGRYRKSTRYYRQALAVYSGLENAFQMAETLERIGHPHRALGDNDAVDAAWKEALKLYRRQGRHEDAERVQRQLE